jgi:hypothetical protein
VVAIATELGTNPKGAYASVKNRLAAGRAPRFKSGRWYYPPGTTWVDTFSPTQGKLHVHPMWFNGLKTFDQVGLYIAVGGSAGAVIRLGVYADDGEGVPTTLVADWGTIVATAAGGFTISISWTPAADLYWLAGVLQGSPGTPPQIRSWQNINLLGMSAGLITDANWGHAFTQTAVSAALPNPFTTTLTADPNAFGIMLHAA